MDFPMEIIILSDSTIFIFPTLTNLWLIAINDLFLKQGKYLVKTH